MCKISGGHHFEVKGLCRFQVDNGFEDFRLIQPRNGWWFMLATYGHIPQVINQPTKVHSLGYLSCTLKICRR